MYVYMFNHTTTEPTLNTEVTIDSSCDISHTNFIKSFQPAWGYSFFKLFLVFINRSEDTDYLNAVSYKLFVTFKTKKI